MKIKIKRTKVSLSDLDSGSLFIYEGTMALKSEYRTDAGAIEAYIIGSGEIFWGGVDTPKDQSMLMVNEFKIK